MWFLGDKAFEACSSISQVTLVNGLKLIGSEMFNIWDGNNNAVPSSLQSITVPSTITYMGEYTIKQILYIL